MKIPTITTEHIRKPYFGPTPERVLSDGAGREYIFRDVFQDGFFQTCQYATLGSDGEKVWHDCREGSHFEEVQPYWVIHG